MNFYWVVGKIDSGEIPLSKPDSNYRVELIMLLRQMRLRYRLIYVHIRVHTIYGRSPHSLLPVISICLKSRRHEFFPTIIVSRPFLSWILRKKKKSLFLLLLSYISLYPFPSKNLGLNHYERIGMTINNWTSRKINSGRRFSKNWRCLVDVYREVWFVDRSVGGSIGKRGPRHRDKWSYLVMRGRCFRDR